MTKTYCDVCNIEITDQNKVDDISPSGAAVLGNLKSGRFEVTVRLSPCNNDDKDICRYCILDAVQTLDDRPRPLSVSERALSEILTAWQKSGLLWRKDNKSIPPAFLPLSIVIDEIYARAEKHSRKSALTPTATPVD